PPLRCRYCNRPGRRRSHSETTGDGQVVGRVDVATQSRPSTREFDRTRMPVLCRRIRPEPGGEGGPERTQGRSTGTEAIGDETTLVPACRGNRFGKFLRLQ